MVLTETPPAGFFDTQFLGLDLEVAHPAGRDCDPYRDKVVLISLSSGHSTIVMKPGPWLSQLWSALQSSNTTMVAHSGAFDLRFLWALGFQGHPAAMWDTLHVERVLTAGTKVPCGLGFVAWRRLSVAMDKSVRDSFTDFTGDVTQRQVDYSHKDADVLIPLMHDQYAQAKSQGLLPTIELENALVPVLAQMEYEGVGFNMSQWFALIEQEQQQAHDADQRVQKLLHLPDYRFSLFDSSVGGINLNSWQQVKGALEDVGITLKDTQVTTLRTYLAKHPTAKVLEHLLDYRSHAKRVGFRYDQYVNPVTGRIHPDYDQTGTVTGRLSCSKPNGQNVPRDSRYRQVFVARPGWSMIQCDVDQQELRILAEIANDKVLQEVCRTSDPHLENARRMYNNPTITADDLRRAIAKNVSYAMAYGANALRVALTGRIPLADAKRLIAYTRTTFKDVEKWATKLIRQTKEGGYTCTMGGRRRYFPHADDRDVFLDNQIRNTPIQGTAADMMKRAMIEIGKALEDGGYQAQMVLTVHDEVVIETPEDEVADVSVMAKRKMEEAGEYYVKSVPMPVSLAVAPHWRK